jgi:hypothetical protein
MTSRRWFNQSQPQTLQIAVFLLYADAVLGLLKLNDQRAIYQYTIGSLFRSIDGQTITRVGNLFWLLIVTGSVLAAYGIANEMKLAYRAGIVIAAAPLVARVVIMFYGYPRHIGLLDLDLLGLLFEVALVALLVHPQSREYERLWFK